MNQRINLPPEVQQVLTQLTQSGYEAYIVGGCVRDQLLGKTPKDWDVTTNAHPPQIQKIFQHTLYKNNFGTVTVRVQDIPVEVTTFRTDGDYSDHRRPDKIAFGSSLQEDVERRDFTINTLAYTEQEQQLVDHFNGVDHLQAKTIQAVGDANKRFQEDALRMLRAIRFAAQLGFTIEKETWLALQHNHQLIKHVSAERIRDELVKMILSDDGFKAIWLLHKAGLLQYIIPELETGLGVEQNLHHIYTVFFHNVAALQFCPSDKWQVRLAALLHDIGKPQVKRGTGKYATFYNHEIVGARQVKKIMRRLAFSKKDTERVAHLVKHHMFYYNVGEITDAGVRRLLQRVGPEHIADLMGVRVADRMGSGVYKEKPYKLVELEKRLAHVQKDPISTSMLAIDGNHIMQQFNVPPGPKVGVVLHRLLEQVLDDPQHNTREYLLAAVPQAMAGLDSMSDDDARTLMKSFRDVLNNMNSFKG